MTFSHEQIQAELMAGLPDLRDVPVDVELTTKLTTFLGELQRWNKAYNLTAVRDPGAMVSKHIFDSLTALPFVHGKTILDVGTGAGLPGIPLALCLPGCHFVLLDSNGKKIRFVQHAIAELGLTNVEARQSRVEELGNESFDTIICRAYTSLTGYVQSSGRLVNDSGRLVAMKGKYPQAELDELPAEWGVARLEQVTMPGLEADRHIVVLEKN
ncbi:MAG: 16S rRNA (guanine(527)-N(7))-methyltransferase RsmG [Chromatiales bacterium]|jgi:16S rRNA (guanine527-N7)-methyltransferase|nr:16S rRNA (guanine(527)-N(7))-methyltransferase RsmG [Chromatiales bacterium]MDP6150189.1 16S rRNA (guanine(527)-N(7))-methyltransferase RsmG [Gammaproteobacteria bacterium]MDP7094104.1 16S rRNA (guanine(527)-N(7))-methyltransferase RsmG [Gammaproteobacteria bacterium]MDP7270963.1 16S rRNA (guanine(527)-N(7))-methyltransferase RsmG [Gammaproteobacteria bacterium]HJP05410.1 16S rRNA (guanine(527)-N(7))-methyltransferase RsmG [Gammaproteobacteria bacterium]